MMEIRVFSLMRFLSLFSIGLHCACQLWSERFHLFQILLKIVIFLMLKMVEDENILGDELVPSLLAPPSPPTLVNDDHRVESPPSPLLNLC